ncbi:hypothetical protein [Devosia indica]
MESWSKTRSFKIPSLLSKAGSKEEISEKNHSSKTENIFGEVAMKAISFTKMSTLEKQVLHNFRAPGPGGAEYWVEVVAVGRTDKIQVRPAANQHLQV